MAKSMTGYGRGEHSSDRYQFGIEIRSTNHRFLELKLRFPRELIALESDVRNLIRSRFSRGYLDVQAFLGRTSGSSRCFAVDGALLTQVAEGLKAAGEKLRIDANVDMSVLAQFKEVFRFEEEQDDPEELKLGLFAAVEEAVASLEASREREGDQILRSISGLLEGLEGISGAMDTLAPETNLRMAETLRRKLDELLVGDGLSPERLHQEAALLVLKSDVTEELERLRGHIAVFRETLGAEGPIGRKMDFLLQEMNRELNTTAAKSATFELSRLAVDGKLGLEKIREQIQNLE